RILRLASKDCLVAFVISFETLTFATFEWTGDVTRLVRSTVACDEQVDVILRRIVPGHASYTFAALGDSIYLIGGYDKGDRVTSRVDRVDVLDGFVSWVAPMTQARVGCCAVASGERLFVFGGWLNVETLLSCEKLDPATNRQVSISLMGAATNLCTFFSASK
uniref:Kelch repeat protein n=1 Tax=Mesocestoides corti TaxID=53468 RepID=A0A5K3FXY9_MESCO